MNFKDTKSPGAVACLAAVVLAGAAVAAIAGPPPLAGSEWGYRLEAGQTDRRFVRFDASGGVHGNGGCNSFRGSYAQTGNDITISRLATTRKACPEPIMANEMAFLAALANARSVEMTHLKLVLLGADGTELLNLARRDWD